MSTEAAPPTTRDDVLTKLREILARDFDVPADAVRDDAHVRVDLRLDSLSLVDFAYLVQKDFGLKIAMEEFRDTRTVGSIADLVAAKLGIVGR